MEYHTIYDLSSQGLDWMMLLLAFLLGFASLAWMARARMKGHNPAWARSLFVAAILFVDFSVAMPYLEQTRLASVVRDGQAQVAHGYISQHVVKPRLPFQDLPLASLAGASQSFCVDGISFDWSAPRLTASHASWMLSDGQALRVTYVEDAKGDVTQRRILRLEVANSPMGKDVATLN